MYDGILQGTCMGSVWFGILSLDMMQQAAAAGKLARRDRTGGQSELTLEALQALLEERQGEEPRRPLPLPVRLSLRPRFYG